MSDSTNLLACPFCASIKIDADGWASVDEAGVKRSGPACDDCGASAESVERWNTRPFPGSAVRFYDVTTDTLRPITQADVDWLQTVGVAFGRLRETVQKGMDESLAMQRRKTVNTTHAREALADDR